jgi:hypothetical protein
MFAWMMYFFANWSSPDEAEKMWTAKKAKL